MYTNLYSNPTALEKRLQLMGMLGLLTYQLIHLPVYSLVHLFSPVVSLGHVELTSSTSSQLVAFSQVQLDYKYIQMQLFLEQESL